jgi:hypothetical protein
MIGFQGVDCNVEGFQGEKLFPATDQLWVRDVMLPVFQGKSQAARSNLGDDIGAFQKNDIFSL